MWSWEAGSQSQISRARGPSSSARRAELSAVWSPSALGPGQGILSFPGRRRSPGGVKPIIPRESGWRWASSTWQPLLGVACPPICRNSGTTHRDGIPTCSSEPFVSPRPRAPLHCHPLSLPPTPTTGVRLPPLWPAPSRETPTVCWGSTRSIGLSLGVGGSGQGMDQPREGSAVGGAGGGHGLPRPLGACVGAGRGRQHN